MDKNKRNTLLRNAEMYEWFHFTQVIPVKSGRRDGTFSFYLILGAV